MTRRPDAEQTSSLPVVLGAGSLVMALLLFIGSTAPALSEQSELRSVQASLEQKLREYRNLLQEFNSRAVGRPRDATDRFDLQALLVAIDSLGYTPAQLLALFPEPKVPD